jgi:hypothetical protein
MNCLNCGKGRPRLWVDGKPFCNEDCYLTWRNKGKIIKEFETDYAEP